MEARKVSQMLLIAKGNCDRSLGPPTPKNRLGSGDAVIPEEGWSADWPLLHSESFGDDPGSVALRPSPWAIPVLR